MFYYIVFLILMLTACLEFYPLEHSIRKAIYIFVTIGFILISGLRWNTGNDWPPYSTLVTNFDFSLPFAALSFEKGFLAFVYLVVAVFGPNFTAYLLTFAVVNIGIRARFLYKYSQAILLIPMLLWGTQTFADITGVRQSLAIAVCLLSLDFVIRRKWLVFLLIVFLANQIHTSTVIFYLAYPVYHVNWSVRTKSIVLAFSVLAALAGSADWIMRLIGSSGVLGEYITRKISGYYSIGTEETYGAGVAKGTQLLLGISKRLLILPFILFFENLFFKKDKSFCGFSNLFLFGNIIYFLVGGFLTMQRLAACFYIFEVVLICRIFANISTVKSKVIMFLFLVLYSLAKLVFTLQAASQTGNQTLLDPYIWIFSEDTYRYMF